MAEMKGSFFAEQSDHWVLPLAGKLVSQCAYDYAFAFTIGEQAAHFTVTIEESFSLCGVTGQLKYFNPENDPLKMGETLSLLRTTVERAIAHKDGRLEIDFEGGVQLRVAAGTGYEPWQISGPDGMLMVSGTDGELAIWSSRAQPDG